jgi:regulator of PEP synthase PpsR (kinase-PPPase family)
MKEIEHIVHMVTDAIAKTAEVCAASLEASGSTISGAQALRNFAKSIREVNEDRQADETVH